MSPSLSRLSRRALVALGAMSSLALGPAVAGAASSAPTAASVIKAADVAMGKQTGVHIVALSQSGKTSTKVVVDLGKTIGVETIDSGTRHVTITLTAKAAYVQGSSDGLIKLMGLTTAQQKKVGTKAISMASGTSSYASFKASLTTAALAAFMPSAKGTTLLPVAAGSGHYQLTWTSKGKTSATNTSIVLTLSISPSTLPLVEKITAKSGGGSTTFSHWGESVHVSAPSASNTVTFQKVFG